MEKVGILYICTGKYNIFWEGFYKSSEKFLLPHCEKTYFVFTDAEHIMDEDQKNVRKIFQANLGWPGNTLFRFEMFRRIENALIAFDYLFFFNANTIFGDFIYNEEILPATEGLMAVRHPWFYDKDPIVFPYERNPGSLASIAFVQGQHYFLGGVNGGRTEDYLMMIKTLEDRIRKDLDSGITAIHNDESHLNKYLLDKTVKVLDPSYGYPDPEVWSIPFTPKVIFLDKNRWGGHQYLRN